MIIFYNASFILKPVFKLASCSSQQGGEFDVLHIYFFPETQVYFKQFSLFVIALAFSQDLIEWMIGPQENTAIFFFSLLNEWPF